MHANRKTQLTWKRQLQARFRKVPWGRPSPFVVCPPAQQALAALTGKGRLRSSWKPLQTNNLMGDSGSRLPFLGLMLTILDFGLVFGLIFCRL
jgi:hypothetical protein